MTSIMIASIIFVVVSNMIINLQYDNMRHNYYKKHQIKISSNNVHIIDYKRSTFISNRSYRDHINFIQSFRLINNQYGYGKLGVYVIVTVIVFMPIIINVIKMIIKAI